APSSKATSRGVWNVSQPRGEGRGSNPCATATGVLLLEGLRPLAPGRGLPLAGASAARQPRVVAAAKRGRRRERGSAPALRREGGPDDRRRRGQARPRPARDPARLP